MKNHLTLIGMFFMSFGAVVTTTAVEPWFWWVGRAMEIAGPLLLGSRAFAALREQQKLKPKRKSKLP